VDHFGDGTRYKKHVPKYGVFLGSEAWALASMCTAALP
jgi:hypothetical protein